MTDQRTEAQYEAAGPVDPETIDALPNVTEYAARVWKWHAAEGFHFVWRQDVAFRPVKRSANKECRYTVGPGHATCRMPARAEFLRNTRWWAYCGRHLYGRLRVNDTFWTPAMRPDSEASRRQGVEG